MLRADLALVLVTLVWGTTFVVVKVAVETVDPLFFVAARFGLGALTLGAVYSRRLRTAGPSLYRAGGWLGLALFAGFALQTLGLRETTPARGGFITGLSVVLVPVFSAILLRRRPHRWATIGVGLSALGLAALSAPLSAAELAGGSWRGDLLVLGCAVAFALHILGVGHYAGRMDVGAITATQLAVVALLAAVAAVAVGAPLPTSGAFLPAIAYMGVVATALVFLLQNWAQIHTSSTHTALIFALEPVFAALFSALFYGEALTLRTALGGGLIVAGVVLAEATAPSTPTS